MNAHPPYTDLQRGAILMWHIAAGESYSVRQIAAECQCSEVTARKIRDQLVTCGVATWDGSALKAKEWDEDGG